MRQPFLKWRETEPLCCQVPVSQASRTAFVVGPYWVARNFPLAVNRAAKDAGAATKLVTSNPLRASQTLNRPRSSVWTTHLASGEMMPKRLVELTHKGRVSLRVRGPKAPTLRFVPQ